MKPGVHYDIPARDYHDLHACNSTTLKTAYDRSLAHAQVDIQTPSKQTGKIGHALILEPEKEILVTPNFDLRSKAQKPMIRKWVEDNLGIELETVSRKTVDNAFRQATAVFADQDTLDVAQRMRDSVAAHPDAKWLLFSEDGKSEVTVIGELDGVTTKVRLDRVGSYGFCDLKTTKNASARKFGWDAASYKYPLQMAWYHDRGGEYLPHIKLDYCFIVAVENTPPYACNVFHVGPSELELGRAQYTAAFERYKVAWESDEWPSYDQIITPLALPGWAYKESV